MNLHNLVQYALFLLIGAAVVSLRRGYKPRTDRLKRKLNELQPPIRSMPRLTRIKGAIWSTPFVPGRPTVHTRLTPSYRRFFKFVFLRVIREILKSGHRPVIVLVGGVSRSGKSTLVKRLAILLGEILGEPDGVAIIHGDGYFKHREESFDKSRPSKIGGRVVDGEYDNPSASDLEKLKGDLTDLRDGREIRIVERDVASGEMLPERLISPATTLIVFVEGLYVLHPSIARLGDIRLGIVTSLGNQFATRMIVDPLERKRPPTTVARKLIERWFYQAVFVLSTYRNAELVFYVEDAHPDRFQHDRGLLSGRPREIMLTSEPATTEYAEFLCIMGVDPVRSEAVGKMRAWKEVHGIRCK